MDDIAYILGVIATITFSITGVLAVSGKRIDIFGVVAVGFVTAVGGGTIRDVILDVPVFWIEDALQLLAAVAAALLTFVLRERIHKRYQLLLYLDGLGVGLFASTAVVKTLGLGLEASHAMVMGVITGIGGGMIRDLLTGHPTLLMSRDLYATPILLGMGAQIVAFSSGLLSSDQAMLLGVATIFIGRSLAVFFHWQMPSVLTFNGKD
jgi:uncharacterized membrane protein YeiH